MSSGTDPAPRADWRTLFLTLDPAWPTISGADLRNWQNAVAASAIGPVATASVTAAVETPPAPVTAYALTDRPPGSVWRQAPTAAAADLLVPDEARDGLRRAIDDFAPNAIVVEHPALVALAAERPRTVRLIADLHNIELVAEARAAAARFFLSPRRWRAARAARASARAERAIAAAVDAVWVCSREEAARLAPMAGSTPVHVVPNGTPRAGSTPDALYPMRPEPRDTVVLLMTGHLGYPPNVDAAGWLANRILPALRHRIDARLVLAGRSPAPAVRALNACPRSASSPTRTTWSRSWPTPTSPSCPSDWAAARASRRSKPSRAVCPWSRRASRSKASTDRRPAFQ